MQKSSFDEKGCLMNIIIGDLFESRAKTLVNTVNCVGVMGKGIALEFKKRYPAMFEEYEQLCSRKEVAPGKPYHYSDLYGTSIINFPTKDHWRSPSKFSYIASGLDWFRANYKKYHITSVAFPPLGCGNGGLPWTVVGPLMYEKLHDLPIDIEIYAPFGTPVQQLSIEFMEAHSSHSSWEMEGKRALPFNKYWLFILYAINKMNHNRYSLNVGRTIRQKICYVLSRSGLPMGFTFRERSYGPFSAEVDQAVMTLSNANYMTEKQAGQMIETVVSPSFSFPYWEFTEQEIQAANRAIDLLCRIKNTDHAEMIATVLFSYDELKAQKSLEPRDIDVYQHIIKWKKRWEDSKKEEVIRTIWNLASLGWMTPVVSGELQIDDDLF